MIRLRWIVGVGSVVAGLAFFAVQGSAQGQGRFECERQCFREAREAARACPRGDEACLAIVEANLRACLNERCGVVF